MLLKYLLTCSQRVGQKQWAGDSSAAAWGRLIEALGRDKACKIRAADEPVDLVANPHRAVGSVCCEVSVPHDPTE